MASMACCRTALHTWSLGSSSSSSCRAQPGWDLAAASTQCHQTQALPKGCPQRVPVPGGLATFPRSAGCPLTLIFSASSYLWQ